MTYKNMIKYFPILKDDVLLGSIPDWKKLGEIAGRQVDKYYIEKLGQIDKSDVEFRNARHEMYKKYWFEYNYFFSKFFRLITEYTDGIRDEESEIYIEALKRINDILDNWKWQLPEYQKYFYLPAKQKLRATLTCIIYNPVGHFNTRLQIRTVNDWVDEDKGRLINRIFEYLSVLIAGNIIRENKKDNIEEYNRRGFEDEEFISSIMTPEEKAEINEIVTWD